MLHTKCSECVFNKKENGIQVGCELKNIDNIKKELVENNFVLSKFCTGFRPQHWVDDVGTDDKEKLLELVKTEMIPPINYVIIFEDSIDKLKTTLESIRNIKNKNPRSTLTVVNKKVEFNEEIYSIINKENFIKDRIYLVYIIDDNVNPVDQAFKNMINGYATYVYAGYEFKEDFVNKINDFTNLESKNLYLVHDQAHLLFFVKIFQFLNGNKKTMHGEVVNDLSFIERVTKENYLKTGVYNWKDFFNE